MNPALILLRKVLRVPVRLAESLDELTKKDRCLAAPGVELHPTSRVENNQSLRSAIVIGANSHILGQLTVLKHGGSIRIGESCFVGESSRIWSAASIEIGNRVLISHNVNIHDNNSHSPSAAARHDHFKTIFASGHPAVLEDVASAPIVIHDDAWIGFNATILKGVTIGQGAVVGAGTIVTRDVEPYTIIAGNPARVIGSSRP